MADIPTAEKTVLHLISSIGFFGAENVMVQLSKELRSLKYRVYVGMLGNSRNSYIEAVKEAEKLGLNIQVFPCNGKFDIKTIIKIRQYIKRNRIGVIHSHGYKSNFYSILASFNMNVLKITTCHNWLGNNLKMKLYARLDKFLLNKFDRIIAVSDNLMEEILRNVSSRDKVMVINNGVDLSKFQPSSSDARLKKTFGMKEGETVVSAIGRLTEEKGQIYLIRAFAEIVPEFPKAKLLIVGDGPLRNFLESEAGNLGIKDKVIFAGIRNDIPEILNITDVFVLPSLEEAMPMALLEAMAAKKPITATRVGAVSNIIEDKVSGLLIGPKDPIALSRSIAYLLKNKAMASFFGENSYDNVRNNFSAGRMAQEYIKAYKSLTYNMDTYSL